MTDNSSTPQEISDTDLDAARGGAETVHLYLKSNDQEIQGELRKAREIVVVGSKVKDVI